MSMAGWRCFHMCALLIFFLSCEELVLLLFPLCQLCIQAGNAARRGPETNPGTIGPTWSATSPYFKRLFSKSGQSWISHHSLQSISRGLSCTFPVARSLLFTAIRHIASEMACSYGGLTITRPPLRPLDLNLIWFIIAIRDVHAHAQRWCYQ